MAKHLTYNETAQLYITKGCELLTPEEEYKGVRIPVKYKCKCGRISSMTVDNFKRGHRCPTCGNNESLTQEYVDNYISSFGWTNTSVYTNNRTKLELICPTGHKRSICFSKFKSGNRCAVCSKKEILTPDLIEDALIEEGWAWINKSEYKNTNINITIKCPKGHTCSMRFQHFKNGVRCKTCFYTNNVGANHARWKEDRTRAIRSQHIAFNHDNIDILKDDPNYDNFIYYKQFAKDNKKSMHELRNIYSVDHIYPRIAFIDNDLDKKYDIKIVRKICNLRENLQILELSENVSKNGKYNQEEFIEWFNIKLQEVE